MLLGNPCWQSVTGNCQRDRVLAISRRRCFHLRSGLLARRSGLFKFIVLMAAASNMVYGSTLSPPRLAQLREAVASHYEAFTSDTGPLWLLWGNSIATQRKVDCSLPDAMKKLSASLKNSELLQTKGDKVIWA